MRFTNSQEWIDRDHARSDYDDMPLGEQYDMLATQADAIAKEGMKRAGIDPATHISKRNGNMNFKFKITYFKPSGKYYSDAEVEWVIRPCEGTNPPAPYIYDAVAKLRGLRDTGGQGALPGLCGEGWDGPILLTHDDGCPCLILPRNRNGGGE